jgi:hypothetical protein
VHISLYPGAKNGTWDIIVKNSNGKIGEKDGAFTGQ